jgi:hypothetical protein
MPGWKAAWKDSKKNSDDPDSDNSSNEQDAIPVTGALSQYWFAMDTDRDGFSTMEDI